MKLHSIIDILELIPELGSLELSELEVKIRNELDRRFNTKTTIFVRKEVSNVI